MPEPMCACRPTTFRPLSSTIIRAVVDLGQIDPELHAAAGRDDVGVMSGADVGVDAQRDRILQIERENAIDLRHRVDVDDDPLVADRAQVVVGDVRAGEPDLVAA